jgi:hypothetical protein
MSTHGRTGRGLLGLEIGDWSVLVVGCVVAGLMTLFV